MGTMNFSVENMHRWDVLIAEAQLRLIEMKQSVSRLKVMKEEGWDCPFELKEVSECQAKSTRSALKERGSCT